VVDRRPVAACRLFADIVGSAASAAELGDCAWASLLAEHHMTSGDHSQ
jgi:hypothetical protein